MRYAAESDDDKFSTFVEGLLPRVKVYMYKALDISPGSLQRSNMEP